MITGPRQRTFTHSRLAATVLLGVAIAASGAACSSSAKSTAAGTTVAPIAVVADGSALPATSTTESGSAAGSGAAPSSSDGQSASGADSSSGGGSANAGFAVYNAAVEKCPAKEPAITPGASTDAPFTSTPATVYITLTWKISGSPSAVYDAVDDANGAYESGLPAAGTAKFARHCDGMAHTYYVVAVVDGKKIVKSTVDPGKN
jgi:hypothetical protein